MKIRSWAPGHATLFFAVPRNYDNPEEMGSIGGGINFDIGVTTSITVSQADKIFWNNQEIRGNVTKTVVELFKKIHNMKFNLHIEHESALKTGYGFSTSGAGAIGTALGLNELFQTGMENIALYSLAHKAEIINQTGLGSVVGQISGGIELRLSQGGPKRSLTISFHSESEVIIGLLAPLSTKDVLTSSEQMDLVTISGIRCIEQIKNTRNLTLMQIINSGRKFMETCGLMTPRIENIISQLDSIGEVHSTMAMIGESVIINPIHKTKVLRLLEKNNIEYLETTVSSKQPHIVYN
ncbi:MAG: pantoate kinase [Candidatus Heimdallarchaeota archaeon]